MIPKIIHYCWFSGEPFDEKTKMCMKTWKEKCPDYEIRECNAKNFDMEINDFVKEAYKAKKWAFVADYARLYLLYKYGGVYMDGDVELVKNIDCFLALRAFMGQERKGWISAGIIGSEAGNDAIKTFLDYYEGRHFINKDGTYNQITNVQIITHNLFESYGLLLTGDRQKLGNLLEIYPVEFFSPKDSISGEINCTHNTYAIHHFNNGWKDGKIDITKKRTERLLKIFSPSMALFIAEASLLLKLRKGNWRKLCDKYRTIKLTIGKKRILKLRRSLMKDLYK